jgi:undecaprenyl diphosphate synthase
MKNELDQSSIQNDNIPVHLGLILDGNRRWARERGLPTLEGHKIGYENLKTIALAAIDRGVQYISAYVFSVENWNRSPHEVKYLMKLLKWVATHEVNNLNERGVRVRFAGSYDGLSQSIIKAIQNAEQLTEGNSRGTVVFCLNYGGHQEIVDAANSLITRGERELTVDMLTFAMYASDVPPIDLVVRTSGEQRLSGFMLWRVSYAELYFSQKYWPDFSESDLDEALQDYSTRKRRFGGK